MKGPKHLLDASALLALLLREPGYEAVMRVLDDCGIHGLNLSEVIRRMTILGASQDEIEGILEDMDLVVDDNFGVAQAKDVGFMAPVAKKHRLSLADCVCLTTARKTGQTVITADRKWSEIPNLELAIIQIRPIAK